MFSGFWWFTGKALHPHTEIESGTAATTARATPAGSSSPTPTPSIQSAHGQSQHATGSGNVSQQQHNSGGTNTQQNSSGTNSPNISGNNNTVIYGTPTPEKDQGAFKEAPPETVSFSLGEHGIKAWAKTREATPEHPRRVIETDEGVPIWFYVKDGVFVCDVKLWSGNAESPVEIKANEFTVKHPGWDKNFNDRAFEVVNEEGTPIFQLIRQTRSDFVFKGFIFTPTVLLLAGDDMRQVPVRLAGSVKLSLIPIFKYPSWKYPGKYADGSN